MNSTMASEAVSRFSSVHRLPTCIVLVLGRLATRLLRYFKDCWSECQPMTPQLDDDFDDVSNRENPLKRRLHESSSTIVTRDKNNNTKPRKNYRQLAGLSDDDDDDHEADYVPMPTVKRVGHRWGNETDWSSLSLVLDSSVRDQYTDLYHCGREFSCLCCLS